MLKTFYLFFLYFRLEEFLGNGQFGSVSKATWNTAGGSKKVAVKIMRPSALDSNRVKFLQEAAIMGQFFHSNVVKLHGVVTVGEPVSYTNICFFVASVSYRKLDIGLGMRLVNFIMHRL